MEHGEHMNCKRLIKIGLCTWLLCNSRNFKHKYRADSLSLYDYYWLESFLFWWIELANFSFNAIAGCYYFFIFSRSCSLCRTIDNDTCNNTSKIGCSWKSKISPMLSDGHCSKLKDIYAERDTDKILEWNNE